MIVDFEMETAASEIRDLIRTFLGREGGKDNGYSTWAEGRVTVDGRDTDIPIKWKTPDIDELTGRVIRFKSSGLVTDIMRLLHANKIYMCELSKRHVESGCWETSIVLTKHAPVTYAGRVIN